jgi:hypothetical protein
MSSRRSFLSGTAQLMSASWLALNWPAIAAAAHHADDAPDTPPSFKTFNAAEAADVDAIASQIVPSGTTPGAHEAHVVYFIDQAFATFFAGHAKGYRQGLSKFQSSFRSGHAGAAFAAAARADQIAYLKTLDSGEFFQTTRLLTVLGLVASPKYGGNYQKLGWKIMGFDDQHAFQPPFGFYDRDYPGFVGYGAKERA